MRTSYLRVSSLLLTTALLMTPSLALANGFTNEAIATSQTSHIHILRGNHGAPNYNRAAQFKALDIAKMEAENRASIARAQIKAQREEALLKDARERRRLDIEERFLLDVRNRQSFGDDFRFFDGDGFIGNGPTGQRGTRGGRGSRR